MFESDFIAQATGAMRIGPAQDFSAVGIDSRTIDAGALYVALSGARYDGHDFAAAAVAQGARGVLVARPLELPAEITQWLAPDPLAALQALAQAHRRRLAGTTVVAITGSNGKTTTKALAASVLAAAYGEAAVHATRGNLNNHIGVPLTLLALRPMHRVAVVEMGMNHFDEIALLSRLAEPDCALITNAGPAHLEGVGSLEGVAKAKGEIFEGLRRGGVAILNRDDAYYAYWRVIAREYRQLSFGFSAPADASQVQGALDGCGGLEVRMGGAQVSIRPPLAGRHNASNVLAVAALAHSLGIDAETIRRGVETATIVGGRLERKRLGNGASVIDDSYNANPASMIAAIDVLACEPGRRVLVIGDMAELGAYREQGHAEVARAALAAPLAAIHAVGPSMAKAFAGASGRAQVQTALEP
ncbi:MAG: UDP-N-acetylmuramoyl-tripeptide--D-alanyl-D-alanine ligase, partial [Casimicrobiaceae bacterium]